MNVIGIECAIRNIVLQMFLNLDIFLLAFISLFAPETLIVAREFTNTKI